MSVIIKAGKTTTVTIGLTPIPVAFDPWNYDTDGNGIISKAEAIVAVQDYFDGVITKAQAIEVVKLYYDTGEYEGELLSVPPPYVPPPTECTPGDSKCEGYNYYSCDATGYWRLRETNSPMCGYVEYVPPPPPPPETATTEEKVQAVEDYYAGLITKEEAEAIVNLPEP